MSNHLGFNGFVESSDGYIVFVKRNSNLSIGKNTYSTSVGASLKVKYALLNQDYLNEEGVINAVYNEIYGELKIHQDDICNKLNFKDNIIAAYRDLVEGGKPQLLFYAKSKKSKEEIANNFKAKLKKKKGALKRRNYL